MKSSLLAALLLAASPVFCNWSNPEAVSVVFYNVGCGDDAGKSLLFTSYTARPSNPYVLKSSSPIFAQTASILERAVVDQAPVQFFTRLTDSTATYSYIGDDATCHTKSWTEITGIAIDHN